MSPTYRAAGAVTALDALSLGACIEVLGPDVGPASQSSSCAIEDSDPEVSFQTDIQAEIFEPRCARCHTPDGDSPIGIERGGLDLSSYTTLRAGGVESGAAIVVDGDACASVLLQKLGDDPPFGARMPFGRSALSDAEQQTIGDWIVEGAQDD